jgi:hypothetical protein
MIHRRLFLGGLLAAAAGPAIVRASSLMRVVPRSIIMQPWDVDWCHPTMMNQESPWLWQYQPATNEIDIHESFSILRSTPYKDRP